MAADAIRARDGDDGASGPTTDENHSLTTVYQEVCGSFHAVDEFRGRVLGLLPVASGAGIFLLLNNTPDDTEGLLPYFPVVGAFGILVTLGLFIYELRNMKLCSFYIAQGKRYRAGAEYTESRPIHVQS
jgi:hypothetical protein